jgi:hypothetical protein
MRPIVLGLILAANLPILAFAQYAPASMQNGTTLHGTTFPQASEQYGTTLPQASEQYGVTSPHAWTFSQQPDSCYQAKTAATQSFARLGGKRLFNRNEHLQRIRAACPVGGPPELPNCHNYVSIQTIVCCDGYSNWHVCCFAPIYGGDVACYSYNFGPPGAN